MLEKRDIHDMIALIRLLYSDSEIFNNAASRIFTISAILEEKMMGNAAASAVTITDLLNDFDDAKRLLEATIKNENCVQMEGEQVRIYGLLADTKATFPLDVATGDYSKLVKKLRLLANALFTLSMSICGLTLCRQQRLPASDRCSAVLQQDRHLPRRPLPSCCVKLNPLIDLNVHHFGVITRKDDI